MDEALRVRPDGHDVRPGGFRVRAGGLPHAHARETLELTLKKPAAAERPRGGPPPADAGLAAGRRRRSPMIDNPTPDRALNARWPLPPRCDCGAVPGSEWPACAAAVAQGRQASDADVENCERWQARAVASDWWSGQ